MKYIAVVFVAICLVFLGFCLFPPIFIPVAGGGMNDSIESVCERLVNK